MYFLKLNNDLKKLSFLNLWQKRPNTSSAPVLCIDSFYPTDSNWSAILKNKLTDKIELLNFNSDIERSKKFSMWYVVCQELSSNTIARLAYEFIPLNTPKFLLIHFPFIRQHEGISHLEDEKFKIITCFKTPEDEYNFFSIRSFINFSRDFQMINNLCKTYNIQMYWTSNCPYIRKLPKKYLNRCLNPNYFFVKQGPNYHKNVAKRFLKFIKNKLR